MGLTILKQLGGYTRLQFSKDFIAAIVVTVLLIPQSLAYSMLAGLPPEVGLYASILPLAFYAFFGSSSTLSVGPVAVISLMTASALSKIAVSDDATYLTGAVTLALLCGIISLAMGLLRLGVIATFLSHTVVAGFITASCLIIAFSQLRHILGVEVSGDNMRELLSSLQQNLSLIDSSTLAVGLAALTFLFLAKRYATRFLRSLGFAVQWADILSKAAPVLAVVIGIVVAFSLNLADSGVAITGFIPAGLPAFSFSIPDWALIEKLLFPAAMIALIGYVESVSVANTLASKRRERINPDRELIGLGAANIASAFSSGMPVTGGFSRSVVNFDAGAVTQLASIMTAAMILLACLFLTPLLFYLPKAVLAATIIIAVLGLLDFKIFRRTWSYSKSDFFALMATLLLTLLFGVEVGVSSGVLLSVTLHLYRTSKPHIAEVGLIEGSHHFRNVERFEVHTSPKVLTLRQDESLFFANAAQLESRVLAAVFHRDSIAHVIIQCSAINEIDFSALEMLESLNSKLMEQGIHLHLSEVKGPVMDKLKQTGFLNELSGSVFLTQYEAFSTLS